MPAPTNGLVLFWNMETLVAGQISDLSNNANRGTISGPVDAAGKVGRARSAGTLASTLYIRASSSTTLNLGLTADSYTVCAWVQLLARAADQTICRKTRTAASSLPWGMDFRFASGKARWQTFDGVNNPFLDSTSTALNSSGFQHVVGVRSRGTGRELQVYINGVASGTTTDTSGYCRNSGTVDTFRDTGGLDTTEQMTGVIDEVRIYNRALTAAEVSDVFNDLAAYPLPAVAGVGMNLRGVRIGVGRRMRAGDVRGR